jgi:hypothetical protein
MYVCIVGVVSDTDTDTVKSVQGGGGIKKSIHSTSRINF